MKKLFYLTALTLCFGLANTLNSQTLVTHDFNDGELEPYEIRKTDQEDRVEVIDQSVQTFWDEDLYNGTNSGRKAQFMPIGDPQFTQHIWMGLSIKIHSDYMAENTNTNAGLMQIWGYNGSTGSANHMCMLKFDGRNGGALCWQHRYNSVSNKTHYLIQDDFPRNEFVDIIIHVKLSYYNEGTVQIWVNGDLTLDKTNQTIGWGDMNEDGMYNGTYCFGTSLGQYNYLVDASYDDAYDGDDHYFDGHLDGETRTVSYDNVSVYNGTDGYDLVDPSEGTTTTTGSNYQLVKRNADGFAIDGGSGGVVDRSLELYTYLDHANLTWTEISTSDGYYIYQKYDTDVCMDGGSGGENGQDVTLQTCDESDYAQQWEKIDAGDDHYRLQKRGTNYSLDGGNDGESNQKVYLWTSISTEQNQQWRFDASSLKSAAVETLVSEEEATQNISVYPNPVNNILTIELKESQTATVEVINPAGQTVLLEKISGNLGSVDLTDLNSGMYMLRISCDQNVEVRNILKK